MMSSHGTFPLPHDATFSFTWPANTFATTLVGTNGQTYEAIHLDSGLRCVKIDRHESPVVLIDVSEGKKVLLSAINPFQGNDWSAFAEALLRASKDAPTIACDGGVTFPRVESEIADAEESPSMITEAKVNTRPSSGVFSDDPGVVSEFLWTQFRMSSRGCSVAEVTAMDFSLETMSDPAAPIEFKDVFLFALIDTVGGVETVTMSFLFGPDSWVRA